MLQRYNRVSRELDNLTPRTKVLLLTHERNPRWTISGSVVECLPYRQYKIKLHGSGRIVVRNRKFLRPYIDNQPSPVCQTSPTMGIPVNNQQKTTPVMATESQSSGTTKPLMAKRLLSHNKPGLSETFEEIPHRTTRSGKIY